MTKEHFLFGSDGVLYAWLKLNSSGTPIDSEYYVWLEGEPVTILKGSNQAWMLHNEHLGRPIGMTAPDGTLAWRGEFEAFGTSLAPRVSTAGFEPRFRFPGQWDGGDLGGLVDNHFRSYVPAWGRYSQADPVGLSGGGNLFAYAFDTPTRWVDPLGLQVFEYVERFPAGVDPLHRPPGPRGFCRPSGCTKNCLELAFGGPIPDSRVIPVRRHLN